MRKQERTLSKRSAHKLSFLTLTNTLKRKTTITLVKVISDAEQQSNKQEH